MVPSVLKRFKRYALGQFGIAPLQESVSYLVREVGELKEAATGRPANPSGPARDEKALKTAHQREGILNAILHASPEAYFDCVLNDCRVMLPRDTLRTMVHCVHAVVPGPIVLYVETPHYEWLRSKVRPGEIFLDVGASTGAMALPMAKHPEGPDKVIAFEPARSTNRRLRETLRHNRVSKVEVVDCAVADRPGTASFSEYAFDETGQTPWLPEGSAITSGMIDSSRSTTYEVPVTTLDAFMAGRADAGLARAMKIDVEGFEVQVLEGARAFLRQAKPHIAIDIHKHPFQDGDTEPPVREVLGAIGYRFENRGHVLLCTPTTL